MNITRESAGPAEITLIVEMDPEDEEPFMARSYRRLVTRVQIPGFRRGKTPRSIVERHLGRSALIHEALDFMVPETLEQILEQENLKAFMEPDLEILTDEPVSFKAVVPLEPLVELGDSRSIQLERPPVEITDEQVDEVIERLRYDAAPWEPASRPVQFGDLLTLDVDGTIGGEQTINSQGIDFIPQPDNPLPVPGFSVHLEGMSEGQAKGFALTIPEDHHQAQYAGQQCDLQVKVLSIKEKKLPELDDEFAKGIRDGYESLEALGNSVRQQLTETSENASLRQLEQDILEELLKISTIQASDLIYQRERDHLYEERERTVRSRRIDMDAYLSYLGTTDEDWREQLKPEADRRLETYLVLRKLAQQEDIDVDQGELQAEIDSMVAASGDSGESMRGILSSDNVQDSIRSSLLSRKVMARLVEIVEGRLEATGPTGDAEEQPGEDDGSSGPEEAADAPSPDQEGIEEGADPDAE